MTFTQMRHFNVRGQAGRILPAHYSAPGGQASACSQDFVNVELDRLRMAGTARQSQYAIEPIESGFRGLETHDGTKIVAIGRDRLARRELSQHVRRSVPQPFARDQDARAGLGLDDIPRFDVGSAVSPDDLPVGASGQNVAAELLACN